jgi:hypothetical protein
MWAKYKRYCGLWLKYGIRNLKEEIENRDRI